MFLGGPLYYDLGLRQRFTETLKLSPENAVFPSFALFAVAAGAAIYADTHGEEILFEDLIDKLKSAAAAAPATVRMPPLFREQAEYEAFKARPCRRQGEGRASFRLHRKGLALASTAARPPQSWYLSGRGDRSSIPFTAPTAAIP